MESSVYLIIKQIIVALLIVGAFGLFTIKIKRLIAIMKGVKGSTPVPVPQVNKEGMKHRMNAFWVDVMGQSNVRRKPGIGLAHTAIFFGFLCIQPHSLELMVRGVFPTFSIHNFLPTFYTGYMIFGDVMATLCLAGFGYVFYRRVAVKPSYLPLSNDAFKIIGFTVLIVVTYLLLNALSMVSEYAANGHVFTGLPIAGLLATIFGMSHWSVGAQNCVFEILYWVHLLTILGFLIYIPGSKHLHLLAAVPNVVLKPQQTAKSIAKTDVEDENAETFGLGFINEINWKQVLDLYACTECGRCQEQCPAARSGKGLSPREFIHDLKLELFDNADGIITAKEEFPQIIRENGHIIAEHVWDCTTCRACEKICPVNIQHLDFMIELRKYQVLMEAAFPAELGDTFTNLENQSNPWGFPTATRGDWAKELDVPHISECPDADIVYFAGSALSLEDRGKKISQSLIRVLQYAGVKVAILGADEQDSGDDARRSGNEYLAQGIIQTNVEIMKEYGVKKVLTACPHTYNILKNEYPQFGAEFEVIHHTEFLNNLMMDGKIKLEKLDPNTTVKYTYHDSCYLGRWNDIFEAPRKIINRLPSARLVEMADHHDKNLCCGGGGGRMFMEETEGERINVMRAKQANDTGADIVAVACPYCLTMFSDGLKELETSAKVMDIAEILDEMIIAQSA